MKLYEEGRNRTRLFFPAATRDAFGLAEIEQLAISVECSEGEPLAVMRPVEAEVEGELIRAVTVNSNNQVSVSFPRQLAEALDLVGRELSLSQEEGRLLLAAADQRVDRSDHS